MQETDSTPKNTAQTSNRVCSVPICDKEHLAKGLCSVHYQRVRRYGSPAPRSRSYKLPVLQNNIKHTGKNCTSFGLAQNANGYVKIYYKGKHTSAHRVMCILANGEPPTGKNVAAHTCGRGKEGCLNPNHLCWTNAQGNADDAVKHGVILRGENNPTAVLTKTEVMEIREHPKTYGYRKKLAARYDVSVACIKAVVAGRTWSHI